jgi:hypothetical protein
MGNTSDLKSRFSVESLAGSPTISVGLLPQVCDQQVHVTTRRRSMLKALDRLQASLQLLVDILDDVRGAG